jgi:iron complex outermembrane recepter protein
VIRRKRNILEMAVATAIFTACAAAAMPVSQAAQAANDNGAQATSDTAASSNSTDQNNKNKSKSQVANENLLQPVVISGFVSSLQNSIVLQKNSDSIDEAVSAQEIGQLPGTSIADALGRLPGLAVQEYNGRPQQINIHGLSADFDVTDVNGSIQPSTSNNRDVELNQYPASWFNVIDVHMTPSADLVDQGIAGTIDMQTLRPLSQKGPVAHLNANYQWNTLGPVMPGPGVSNQGHDVDGIFADQFFDHTFGVALGVDLEANPTHIWHQAPWGYATDANGNLIIGGSKNYNISDLLKRNGYLATFQFAPSSAFNSTLDLTYEEAGETQQDKGAEFPLAYGSNVIEDPGTTVAGFDQTGSFGDIYPVIRNDYTYYQDRVYNILWSNDLRLATDWSADLNAGYSRAESDDDFLEAYSGFGYDGPANETGPDAVTGSTVGFSEGSNGELYLSPSRSFTGGNVVLTDPQGWGAGSNLVQAGFINAPHTEDYIGHVTLSATKFFDSGPFDSVEFGVNRERHRKDYIINQDYLVLSGASCGLVISSSCTPTETAPIPSSAIEGTTDALGFMGIGPEVLYNPFALISGGTLVAYPTNLSSISSPPNWIVNENDTTGYMQLNIHTDLGPDVGLKGNVGLQIAHTGQTSNGARVAPNSIIGGSAAVTLLPVVGGTSFTRYLPSLNLVFSLPTNNDVRFSVARTMARPRPDYMNASLGINTNAPGLTLTDPNKSYFNGSGGNPKLLPTMATNYNLSVEHYFGGSGGYTCTGEQSKSSALCTSGGLGYVQLSGYYIQLSDFIDPSAASLYNFSPFVSSYLNAAQQKELGTTYGILNIPQNDGSGHMEGEQFATNLPLGDFTHWLNGFGVLASVDRTLSSVYYAGNPTAATVPGLSKWVENYTLYYQLGGFQASVDNSRRSSFLGEVFGLSATRIEQQVKATSTVDAQVSYAFGDGTLKGLTLIATGSNLTNDLFQTYQAPDPRQVLTWEEYGRLFTVGFSYNF